MQKIPIALAVALVAAAVIGFYMSFRSSTITTATNFEECVKGGYPILGSSPRQCFAPDGTFVEGSTGIQEPGQQKISTSTEGFTYNHATNELIQVSLPFPGATTGSEFTVRGKAKQEWYFNESFPVALVNSEGTIIAEGIGVGDLKRKDGEFIPFAAQMAVPQNFKGPAALVILKGTDKEITEDHPYLLFAITVAP